MFNSALIEYKIIRKQKITWILFTVILILLSYSMFFSYNQVKTMDSQLFNYMSQYNSSDGEADISQPLEELKEFAKGINPLATVNNNLLLLSMIGSILFGIMGAFLVGNEFKLKTVQIRASHYGWSKSVIGKLIVLFLAAVSVVSFVTLVSYLGGYVISALAKGGLHYKETIGAEVGSINVYVQAIITTIVLFFYGSLGLWFSLITRSTLIGGIIAFLIPYVEKFFSGFSLEYFFPTTWLGILIKENFIFFKNSLASPTISINIELSTFLAVCLILLLNGTLIFFCFYIARHQKI